ncbi:MAG: Hydrogen peroxide-inducible genes activator [Betaproteobacteria bacterium ADurb.Bin341]|nr:MAG: Hydrogen peroxide-inducible genes activator [Betaproteobacteria bacterium ADurb.Bin341]
MPIHFDWRTLELFAAVAETGSIARAAERCHTVASAVSKRLSDLESALGTALLERHSKGIRLTPAGAALLDRARGLIEQARQIESEICGFASGMSGQVRLFANISAIVQFLPAALARFAEAHPEVQIHLEEQVSSRVVQAVLDHVADLGIVSDWVRHPDLEQLPFRSDELVLLVPPGHPLANRQCLPFADALDFSMIGLHASGTLQACQLRAAAEAGRELPLRIRVTSFDAACLMVAAGLGIGVVPKMATTPYVASLGLISLELTDLWARRQLYLCRRIDEPLSPAAQRLYAHLLRESHR